jgi:hypothetical protein
MDRVSAVSKAVSKTVQCGEKEASLSGTGQLGRHGWHEHPGHYAAAVSG